VAGHKDLAKRAGTYHLRAPRLSTTNQYQTGDVNTASTFPNPVTDLVNKRADPASDTFTPAAGLGKRSDESREIVRPRSDSAAESLQLSASLGKRKDRQFEGRPMLAL